MTAGPISTVTSSSTRPKEASRRRTRLALSTGIGAISLALAADLLVLSGAFATTSASAQTTLGAGLAEAGTEDGGAADARDADAARVREAGAQDAEVDVNGAIPLAASEEAPEGGPTSSLPERQDASAQGVSSNPGDNDLTLPPLPREQASSPVILDAPAPEVPPVPPEQRRAVVIKTILGLVTCHGQRKHRGEPGPRDPLQDES
jgi:hypothetical protein